MEITTIERIKRLPQQTEESLRDAFSLARCVEDRKSVDHYIRWVRSEAKKIRSADMYNLIRDTYFFAGQYNLDDFLIGMEWNREPQAKFWLPRRKVLEGKHGIATKIQNFMDDPVALFLGISLPPGTGKTTLIKFLLAQIIGKDPMAANMYVSYSDSMTKMLLDSEKSMLTDVNEYCFHDIFPGLGTVTAYNGDTIVAETTVTDNTQQKSIVDLELSNYDRVTITVHNWCLPDHRARIDHVFLGHILTFSKKDIISYTHEQRGDLLTGELPKYGIEFTVDNTDGRWNPSNPTGMEKYLSERQKLTVRYGMDIDGTIEWIKAGTFYLSEWSAPSNGLEARFAARDVFEFLLNVDMKASVYGSLYSLVTYNATVRKIPDDASVVVDESLNDYIVEYAGQNTAAEIIQKAANATCCILRYGRDGVLHLEPLNKTLLDYQLPLSLAYSYPEITLSKPLKAVSVDYGVDNAPYELSVFSNGEIQTVNNDFITTVEQATLVAEWVRDILQSRKTISGELRADPRLDLFDVVSVESKFGTISPVVLTGIKYTFNGAFRASYEGRVIG